MILWIAGFLLREYLWQIVMTLVTAIICLLLVFMYSLSVIYNNKGGGIYWLAAQSQPNQTLALAAPQSSGGAVTLPIDLPATTTSPPAAVAAGFLSAVDRYRLAVSVGFSPGEDAAMALAVALAENGPGNPFAVNQNKPPALPDYGLWQINGIHCGDVGGCQNLFNPAINAQEALRLAHSGNGWLKWCTVPGGCGGLPGVPNFSSLLATARAIARAEGN